MEEFLSMEEAEQQPLIQNDFEDATTPQTEKQKNKLLEGIKQTAAPKLKDVFKITLEKINDNPSHQVDQELDF